MPSLFHLIGLWATATMKGWKLVDDSTDDVADVLLILKAWQCSMYSETDEILLIHIHTHSPHSQRPITKVSD